MKKEKCSCSTKWGIIGGSFLAIVHAVWLLFVVLTPTGVQNFVNWVLTLHSISMPVTVRAFDATNAAILIVLTFVVGFLFGLVLEKITEFIMEKC